MRWKLHVLASVSHSIRGKCIRLSEEQLRSVHLTEVHSIKLQFLMNRPRGKTNSEALFLQKYLIRKRPQSTWNFALEMMSMCTSAEILRQGHYSVLITSLNDNKSRVPPRSRSNTTSS